MTANITLDDLPTDRASCANCTYNCPMCGKKKQFIEEACEWLDENLLNYWSQSCTDGCDFIEDFKKAMEK